MPALVFPPADTLALFLAVLGAFLILGILVWVAHVVVGARGAVDDLRHQVDGRLRDLETENRHIRGRLGRLETPALPPPPDDTASAAADDTLDFPNRSGGPP
jgi:hypothetical protein